MSSAPDGSPISPPLVSLWRRSQPTQTELARAHSRFQRRNAAPRRPSARHVIVWMGAGMLVGMGSLYAAETVQRRWHRAETEKIAEMDRIVAWLAAAMPESGRATIVHNDYKLDNVMLNVEDPGKIAAVLDWEMTTLGDPLADVGLTLCYWTLGSSSGRNDSPGWYSREQLLERYASKTGRDVSGIGYYEVLGVFKLAVILQQIYYRYVQGQTHDERFRAFDSRVKGLIETACALLDDLEPL